jgi:DNA-directed RNA polymerases I, II, and III subunit RPABC4
MASHEAYVPPSSQTFQAGSTFGTGAGAQQPLDPRSAPMEYICADCAAKVTLKKGEQIRCRECGHRILYKQRTKR